jgi:hypothetical protein
MVNRPTRRKLQQACTGTFQRAASLAGATRLQHIPRDDWGSFHQSAPVAHISLDQLTQRLLGVLAADGHLGPLYCEMQAEEVWEVFTTTLSKKGTHRAQLIVHGLESYTVSAQLQLPEGEYGEPQDSRRRYPMLAICQAQKHPDIVYAALLPPRGFAWEAHKTIQDNEVVTFRQWPLEISPPILPAATAFGSQFKVDLSHTTSDWRGMHALAMAAYVGLCMLQHHRTTLRTSLRDIIEGPAVG